uniref:Uncharacterized protein n=1 Tax=Physcomitrium patens TaxID=3218 RepID=A0A2K1KQK6_PHYPA|nr:hypothetical protein PHYPA_006952 [Physcomitrium patens]
MLPRIHGTLNAAKKNFSDVHSTAPQGTSIISDSGADFRTTDSPSGRFNRPLCIESDGARRTSRLRVTVMGASSAEERCPAATNHLK